MATDTRIIRSTTADDAEFRLWAQSVHDALIAVGLTQATDTGQINFATVAKPTSTNVDAGYAVYRFSDALQATRPVFIRLVFGTGNQATTPRIGVAIGTATNGAGTLSGISTTLRNLNTSAAATQNVQSWASGSTNRVTFCMWGGDTTSSRAVAFGVERTHDANGDDSNVGVRLWTAAGSSTADDLSFAGPSYGSTNGFPAAMSSTESTGVNGSDTVFFPIYGAAKIAQFPLTGVLGFYNADAVNGSDVLVDPDGHGTKTYRTLNLLGTGPVGGNSRYAMRFD